MVKVKVFYTGPLRKLTGKAREEVNFNGETISELLREISKNHGETISKQLIDYSTGSLNEYVAILLNGQNIKHLQELRTRVKDGDEIIFLPVVAGGT